MVTGLHDGTNVDVRVGSKGLVLAGGGITGTGAGGVVSFPISKGEVVRLVGTPETDLGGTLVKATKPVQVMTGVPHIYLPFDRGSSDHIEETVFPVETLGKRYHVARPTGVKGTAVRHMVRLFGVADGTTLSYPSGAPPNAPTTLAAGQVHDLGEVDQEFEITGDKPFQVATFLLSGSIADPGQVFGKGDPAQSTVAAVEQYRKKYVFLAPNDYDVSYADVTMPLTANVTIDGAPLGVVPTPINSEFGVARVPLSAGTDGAHVLISDVEVGLQVMGYGFATSYHYPGGLNLKGISPPLPPVR